MPTIRQQADYVTMINYFRVAPADQEEFAQIEAEEVDKYGVDMDAALAASFHRSLQGSRVFNYAQWRSKEALEASQQTEEFKQHLKRMSHLDFTPDPRVFKVVSIIDNGEAPVISQSSDVVPTLTMIFTKPEYQAQISDRLLKEMQKMSPQKLEAFVSSHLLQSTDGERVAVYTQWSNKAAARRTSVEEGDANLLDSVRELADQVEILAYEVVRTYR